MNWLSNFIFQHKEQIFWGASVLVVASLLLNVVILAKMRAFSKRNQVFFSGKDGQTLEDLIIKNTEDLKMLDRDIQELYGISNKINALAQRSVHRTGLVRFNPFKDIGGDQSFSLALLDGKNSGVTLSSLHTREGTRVYVKPIVKGKSEKYTLTEEEIQAVRIASSFKLEKNNS